MQAESDILNIFTYRASRLVFKSMFFSYRSTSLILGFLIAGIIFYLIRKDSLHTRHSFFWFFLASAIMIFGAFPKLSDYAATLLGISYPPVLVMVIGMGLILIKILTADIESSRQERKIRILTEKLAGLEEKVQSRRQTSI